MELTSAQLLAFFAQSRKFVKTRLPERRQSGRLALAAQAKIVLAADRPRQLTQVTICNLSTTGLALVSPRPLQVGTEFYLCLPAGSLGTHWVRCRAIRGQPSPGGDCHVGALFSDMVCQDCGDMPLLIDASRSPQNLDPAMQKVLDELASLVAAPASPESAPTPPEDGNLRHARRTPISFFSEATLLKECQRLTRLKVLLENISTRGVGYQCSVSVPHGSRVALSLRFADRRAKTVLTSVVRCSIISRDRFEIGAEMLDAIAQSAPTIAYPAHWYAPSPAESKVPA